ncbi:hypothetical protein TWF970_008724 [Orbilia oligospora]|uniref:DUF159 domain protein n=1 Tax=Orbilia oligospora TaxID=2813651 RepID=A0A7C8RJI8_ORBOL|nr:hypothetical protein TWF970_008724 [Orbilia oligospora]
MCGRYAMALGRREIRNALHDAGLEIDEDELDVDRVRESYNVAPGYYEPIYRAVSENAGPADNDADLPTASSGDPDDGESETMDESHDGGKDITRTTEVTDSGNILNDSLSKSSDGKVKYVLSAMKWGLVPFWTKRNPGYSSMLKTINCRDDSLYDNKGMWTSMKNKKRCIVVAQGFFEWLKKGKDRVPHFTKRSDGQLLYIAGLWDSVRYEDSTEELYTYTIITTSSSKQLNFLHDRMPVIFEPNSPQIKEWLNPSRVWDSGLQKLLQPFEKQGLECYPVRKEVGKVGNNSPSFIVPLDSEDNKSNIKNFFSKGGKPLQPFKEPEKPWTNPKRLSHVDSDNKMEAEDVKEEDTKQEDNYIEEDDIKEESLAQDTDFMEEAHSDTPMEDDLNLTLNPDEADSSTPLPLLPSPSKSPTKSNPTTPLHPAPKRKLSEISSDDTEPPMSSPIKTPSPVKREQRYKDTALLTIRSKPKFAGEGYDKIPILKDAGAVSTICFELPDPATGKPPFKIEAGSVAVTGAFCEFWGDLGCAGTPKFGARDGDVLDDLKLVPAN